MARHLVKAAWGYWYEKLQRFSVFGSQSFAGRRSQCIRWNQNRSTFLSPLTTSLVLSACGASLGYRERKAIRRQSSEFIISARHMKENKLRIDYGPNEDLTH